MAAAPSPVAPAKGYRAATWARNVGGIVLLFAAYQLWVTGLQEHRLQATLRAQFTRAAQAAPPAAPRVGTAVARLQIERVHLDQYVVEGTDERALEAGPGHYVGSPLPGQPGNVLISGHRTTFGSPFSSLDKLRVGDVIVATTATGEYRYVVTHAPRVVPPSSGQSLLRDLGDNRLTLVTCTPRYAATDRLVVVANLEGPPVASQISATRPARSPPALPSLGWGWSAAPAALVIAAALGGLGLMFGRLRLLLGPFGTWMIISPVWAAGLLLLFEQVRLLLPANL